MSQTEKNRLPTIHFQGLNCQFSGRIYGFWEALGTVQISKKYQHFALKLGGSVPYCGNVDEKFGWEVLFRWWPVNKNKNAKHETKNTGTGRYKVPERKHNLIHCQVKKSLHAQICVLVGNICWYTLGQRFPCLQDWALEKPLRKFTSFQVDLVGANHSHLVATPCSTTQRGLPIIWATKKPSWHSIMLMGS